MGNKNSSIYINLKNTSFFAGEVISGEVCLSLIQNVKCDTLVLEFLGFEETFWEEFSDKEESKVAIRKGYEVICHNSIVLYQCHNRKMNYGKYSFPFVIMPPVNLPGSFSYSSKMTQSAIKYVISATLDSIPEPILGKQEIKLIQNQPEKIIKLSSATISQPIRWCCFHQGNIFMRANTNKSAYLIGEKLEINLEIYSEIRHNNASVETVLYKTVLFKSEKRATKMIKYRIIQHRNMANIGPNAKREPKSLKICFGLDKGFVKQEIDEAYSTRGNLINCSYSIVSTVYLNSITLHPNPNIEIFIDILPKIKRQKHPEINDWNPIKMPGVMLQPSAPQLE
ncbi:unnamed protein product [Blepharisma stoltei]|uniref:Arrestin-like N-terminal domain-containing protein n=1 Tax=Blepharisma stoltei TaxID=1481888 RepID=A0AAU9JNQ4_9CILI|nr:unnamed protein product [Blepharisma stoltei]